MRVRVRSQGLPAGLEPESAGHGSGKTVPPNVLRGGQERATLSSSCPTPAPGSGAPQVYTEEADPEPEPPPREAESPPPPAQVGGSGRRLLPRPGADSGQGVPVHQAESRRGKDWGREDAPSLNPAPRSPDPDGTRDLAERGGGSRARPLPRPHAQQQLLRVQPQLLHGEG